MPAAHAGVLPLVGHNRMRAPLYGQQPAPPQAPAAPVGGGTHRQAFYVQQVVAPTQLRELPVSQASVPDQAVVGDNFTNNGASSSSAAPPPVPRLTLDLLLDLLGRGGPGGAQ